jgi:hypothetical protein
VIRAWKDAVAVEATRAEVVRATAAYTQEAIAARERAEASIKVAKAQATLAEREARERLLKMEA